MSPGLDETQQLRSSLSLSLYTLSLKLQINCSPLLKTTVCSFKLSKFSYQLKRIKCRILRDFSVGSFGLPVQSLSHIFFPVYYIIQYTMHLRQDNCDMIVPTHCVDQIERYVNFEHIVLLNPKILCFLRLFCIFVKIIGILQCISCSFAKTIWWKK